MLCCTNSSKQPFKFYRSQFTPYIWSTTMNRNAYSDQQAHASFQPRSPQAAIDQSQFGQPAQHSSSARDLGAKWLNTASGWLADKWQTAQDFMSSGEAISPDQMLPALRGTAPSQSQTNPTNQPLIGVIDSGFGANEHGSQMVAAIQQENPQATIWQGDGVGTGRGLESLVEFVDVAKATGQSRAVANLSFDLTEVHPDGSTSTRTQLTAEEQTALAYARDNGVLVVASSGNQGGVMSALGQASQASDNLILVGAADGSDRAAYSSYGNGLDLVADVGTAGTSLAAAKVTGAIANIWNANPELSSQQVNQILTTTATDLKAPGRDAETGAGLLNATGAIDLATHTTPDAIVFSGAQLVQQVPEPLAGATWESRDGTVASERTNRPIEGDGPRISAQSASAKRVMPTRQLASANSSRPAQSTSGQGAKLYRPVERPKSLTPPRPAPPTTAASNPLKVRRASLTAPAPNSSLDKARAIPVLGAAVEAVNPNPKAMARVGTAASNPLKVRRASLTAPAPNSSLDKARAIPVLGAAVEAVNPNPKAMARVVPGRPTPGFWDRVADGVSQLTRPDDRRYLPGLDHPVGRFIQDYNVGVGKFLWETGAGIVSLANNPAVQSSINPALGALNQALRPQETNQAYKDMGAGFVSLVSNPAVQSLFTLGAADGINYALRPQETIQAKADMVRPYTDAINSGHLGEAAGRLGAEVGTLFVPGGGAVRGAARVISRAAAGAARTVLPRPAITALPSRLEITALPPRPAITALPSKPAITALPPRLAIEGRTTARPLYDRGVRPGPGQRAVTQEQWRQQRRDQRANQSAQSLSGHGHERHPSQVSLRQLSDRVEHGLLPNGEIQDRLPNRATRFDSPQRELEAVGRARAQLEAEGNGSPVFRVSSQGEVKVTTRRAYTVPGSRDGYGRGVEVQRGGNDKPLPSRWVRRTAQDPNARVVFEYDFIAGQWKEITHFPTDKPVT
jgi:hypothetical protein